MQHNPNADTADILAQGIEASVETAIADAEQHQAPLIIWRDDKIIEVSAAELRAIRNEQMRNT